MAVTVVAAQARTGLAGPGTAARRAHARLARGAGLLALASLVGCTSMAPRDDLAAEVTQYYAAHASEEDGRCTAPEIATVTKRKVLASSTEATRLRVRYSYFDASAPGATDWNRVLRAVRACTGFAERDFTLVRGPLGYQVVEMSGPVREQP
jgi:hypothetical protein